MSVNRQTKDEIIAKLNAKIEDLCRVNLSQVGRINESDMVLRHRNELAKQVEGLQWQVKQLKTTIEELNQKLRKGVRRSY